MPNDEGRTTSERVGRRMVLAGAGTAGALATAAALLPGKPQPQAKGAAPAAAPADGDNATGYRVTDHIRNYYRTAGV